MIDLQCGSKVISADLRNKLRTLYASLGHLQIKILVKMYLAKLSY